MYAAFLKLKESSYIHIILSSPLYSGLVMSSHVIDRNSGSPGQLVNAAVSPRYKRNFPRSGPSMTPKTQNPKALQAKSPGILLAADLIFILCATWEGKKATLNSP